MRRFYSNLLPPTNFVEDIFLFVHLCVIVVFAILRKQFMKLMSVLYGKHKELDELERQKHFPRLYDDFNALYRSWIFLNNRDCQAWPVTSTPGRTVRVLEREKSISNPNLAWKLNVLTNREKRVINMGSYNYLGFSENTGLCADESIQSIKKHGISTCSPLVELGRLPVHAELDAGVAKFLGVESAACFAMGFATNSCHIAAIAGPKSLIISDEMNHASIIIGCRLSRATIQVFQHNNTKHLEQILCNAVCKEVPPVGQNETVRPKFDKIFIIVEGIYSMEGTVVKLPEILALKQKYKAYLYVDEAHSIGVLGPSGRGVFEHFGIDPNEIDVLMGTLTKSFGSMGGYLAGRQKTIDHIKAKSSCFTYGHAMSAACAQQVLTSIRRINDKNDGLLKVRRLTHNTKYFQKRLHEKGVQIRGYEVSPVVTVPLYFTSKMVYAARAMMAKGIGAVVVGHPVTPFFATKFRFCLSADHTKEDLDHVIDVIAQLSDVLCI